MFTGIIREIGTITSSTKKDGVATLSIKAPKTTSAVERRSSVAINGVCLSVVRKIKDTIFFDVIPETQRLTNLGKLVKGSKVNMEPSLALNDPLNGSVVLGHIDGVGKVITHKKEKGQAVIKIKAPKPISSLLLPKGPITIDGVNMTLGEDILSSQFSIYVIPETQRLTTLADFKAGDQVNLEVDYISKIVKRILKDSA